MSVQSMQETETQGLADGAPTEDQNEFSFDKPDEFVRAPNTEDKHNLLMNIFFCFFWQFVCRRSPITDKDIYECGKRDRISAKKAIMEKHWNTQANLYLKEQAKLLRPPAETDNSQTQEDTQQVQQPDVRVKPPSIGRLLLGPVAGPRVALGLLFKALLFVFTILQPAMMKLMLLTVDKRNSDPSILFPFAPAIILILCPFLTGFCQSFAVRHFYHYMGSARATLIAQVYEKTMKLNINSQSNIDTGKMLSLVSSDAIIVGDYLFMPFNSSLIPFQIIVPFILVVLDFGVTAFISIAVLAIFLPLSTLCVGRAAKALKQSMACGDKRNKITNEILQGIRIVKFSGLENVFMDKIGLARRAQEKQTFWYMFWLNMSNGIVANVPQLVNGATLSLFVFTSGVTKEQFASSVIPNLGYLTLMTVEANNVPQYFQGITMVYLSSKRIKEFLLLPEMQVEERGTPSEHNVAVEISEGSFKWPDPPAALKVVGGDKKEAEAKVLANGNDVDDTKSTNETGSVSSVNQTQDESSLFNPTAINPIESPPIEPSTRKNEPESIFNTQPLSPSPTPANPTNLTLQNINVRIEKGSLTMIVGGVGSGKSSLGAAITGEIDRVNGVVSIDGSITFCPQTPWIANTTVRNNIVFGSPFDENKYIRTVRACSLVSDLKLLSAGDQTAIGEKGGNLSGGQKARIQLARAVYADKDIIVLDDPLSAVDAHVAKFLMNECICGVLRGKTVILTTNQLQFLDRADKVVLLNHGHLVAEGSYQQMKEKGINFDRFVITENPPKDKSETPDPSPSPEPTQKLEEITLQDLETGAEAEAGKEIISDEEQNTKGVSPIVYLRFLTTMFPVVLLPFFLLFNLVAEGMPTFQSFWLSTIPSDTFFGGINYQWKIISYSLLTAVALFLMMLRMCFVSAGAKRSNKIVHDTLLSHVIRCPPSFYDTTPVGRILNRFSGDLSQTDTSLIQFLSLVFRQVTDLLGQIVIVSINTPFFLFVGLPVLVVYFIILIVFQRSSRNLMRQNSMARSPVISLYSQILSGAGLTTLRNYNLQGVWRKRFHKALDHWTTLTVLFSEGKNSNQLYTSLVSSCFMAGVVILGWNFMSNAQLGVSITAAAIFSQTAGYIGYNVLDLDAKMTMFERIDFYSRKLPQESKGSKEKVQQSWPQRGDVTFENVKFRYRPGLPFVLRGVNFEIKGGEKIGVCGRTGAGKSSLLFALFRLVELDPTLIPKSFDMQTGKPIEPDPNEEPNGGRVLIDGVDISKVNLSRVRQSIAIIPQDPTLFTGSVRYNLDIAGKASDDRIWEVLDLIEMRDVIANMPAGLDSEVVEGGSNFSAGERQLLCFARAILNNCKIVVLDEATASVDVETDEKIQKTIREQFSDKTVIVIAHRLNTIMDSDRILVLGGGLLLEYDTPANLTSNADSAFCSLLASAAH